jgi:hypothetical protein
MKGEEVAKGVLEDVRSLLNLGVSHGIAVARDGDRVTLTKLGGETLTVFCDDKNSFRMRSVDRQGVPGEISGSYNNETTASRISSWVESKVTNVVT